MADIVELYRRFRPTKLSELVGQDETVKILEEKLKTGKVPHALLLSGNSGCGKTTTARILKKELRCEANYIEINAAESRGIDTIRAISSVIGLGPLGGGNKMYVIDECHRLTSDAQSALLKMLEDCPYHTYFILCTTDPGDLIPTIKTRCTHLVLKPVSDDKMRLLLNKITREVQLGNTSDKVLDAIVKVAEGSARKALVILEKVLALPESEQLIAVESEEVQKQSESIARLLMKRPASWDQIREALKELEKSGEEPERIRRSILGYAKAVLLNGNKKGYFLLETFDSNLYSSGFPGLVRCCFEATQIG